MTYLVNDVYHFLTRNHFSNTIHLYTINTETLCNEVSVTSYKWEACSCKHHIVAGIAEHPYFPIIGSAQYTQIAQYILQLFNRIPASIYISQFSLRFYILRWCTTSERKISKHSSSLSMSDASNLCLKYNNLHMLHSSHCSIYNPLHASSLKQMDVSFYACFSVQTWAVRSYSFI